LALRKLGKGNPSFFFFFGERGIEKEALSSKEDNKKGLLAFFLFLSLSFQQREGVGDIWIDICYPCVSSTSLSSSLLFLSSYDFFILGKVLIFSSFFKKKPISGFLVWLSVVWFLNDNFKIQTWLCMVSCESRKSV
jgi:hypothetical protein